MNRENVRVPGTFRVVCLGGSAGAFAAYSEILRNVPANSGMAFIIVAHRAPEHPQALPQALSFVTLMSVVEVANGMRLLPNQVFVMPPKVEMSLEEDCLFLRRRAKRRGWPNTISVFLNSLAAGVGWRAVAVILSGLDSDGCSEMSTIKAVGGITFAQADAEYTDMPTHAVNTGFVDFFLSPTDIAKGLLNLAAART